MSGSNDFELEEKTRTRARATEVIAYIQDDRKSRAQYQFILSRCKISTLVEIPAEELLDPPTLPQSCEGRAAISIALQSRH